MKTYIYDAMNNIGEFEVGEVMAETADEAITKIRQKRLFPTKIKEKTEQKETVTSVSLFSKIYNLFKSKKVLEDKQNPTMSYMDAYDLISIKLSDDQESSERISDNFTVCYNEGKSAITGFIISNVSELIKK